MRLKDRRRLRVVENRVYMATAAPTTGHWNVGDRCFNSEPAAGEPVSWVCTVAGYPGTWVSEGDHNPSNLIYYFS
jgi:hypothetical protein